MRLLPILLLLILVLPVQAQVYRWVGADGVVHYTDTPPTKTAKPVKLPPLQSYQPGTDAEAPSSPVEGIGQTAPTTPTTPPAPRITAPQSQATIRDAQHQVTVDVNVALKPDEGLIYYLDGQAQNSTPTHLTHYQFNGVERGTHTLSVAITDADGKPLATSTPVTIYMKPPMVHRR